MYSDDDQPPDHHPIEGSLEKNDSTVTRFAAQQIAKKLYGRDDEMRLLLEAYTRSKSSTTSASVSSTTTTSASSAFASSTPSASASASPSSSPASSSSSSSSLKETCLITGPSGTGKTALAHSLRPHVVEDGGFFLSGKFELSQQCQDPYAVFATAMTQFTDSVMGHCCDDDGTTTTATYTTPDVRLPLIRAAMQRAVGQEEGLLTQVFPSLARIMGSQQDKTQSAVTGFSEAKHQFQFLFCQLIRAISAISPLVLFMDDIQWGDQASLDLLQALFQFNQPTSTSTTIIDQSPPPPSSASAPALLCVFTLRHAIPKISSDATTTTTAATITTESQPNIPFSSFLEFVRADSSVTEIGLENFTPSKLNQVLARILQLPIHSTESLTQIIYDQSDGNMFHSLQVLRQLQEDDVVSYDAQSQRWTWRQDDLRQASARMSREGVSDLMVCRNKLQRQNSFTQEVLQVAACMADVIDEAALTIALDNKAYEVNQSIIMAAHEELLVFLPTMGRYRFAHDQIRQAALSTISNVDELSFHIGYKLIKQSSDSLLDTMTFMVVDLINRGVQLLHDPSDRYQAANLNLEAGLKAVSSAAFPDACRCFQAGISFLQGSDYWTEYYQMSLDLFNSAADAELCCQHFERVAELATEVLAHARSEKDKIQAYVTKIHAIGQRDSVREAMHYGVGVLKSMGEKIASRPWQIAIVWDIIKTKSAVKGLKSDDILARPFITDELKHGTIHVLCVLLPYAFQAGSPLTVLIGTRMVQLCLRFGMCKEMAVGFVQLSWIFCKTDKKEGYRMGQLALSIIKKLGTRALIPRIHIVFYFFVSHWVRPIKDSLAPLQHAYQVGMEVGDVEYAMYAAWFHCIQAFYSGMSLPDVEKYLVEAKRQMRLYKQNNSLEICNQLHQFIHNLTESQESEPKVLAGDIAGSDPPTDNVTTILLRLSLSAILAHLFGDMALAERFAQDRQDLKTVHCTFYSASVDALMEGVIAIGRARQGFRPRRNQNITRRCLRKLRALAMDCSDNFLNKQKLLEAELSSLSVRNSSQTNELYGEAYRLALRQGFTYEAALACELAGDFMRRQQNLPLSTEYMEQAYRLYVEWGAKAKVRQIGSSFGTLSITPYEQQVDGLI